jgi:hypothetical protein
MDVASMICDLAEQKHNQEIEDRKISFYVACNHPYGASYKFEIVPPDGLIIFNSCSFTPSRTSMRVILNQILKTYARTFDRNVNQLFLSVCNKYGEVLSTRLPERIRPCVKYTDLLRYDADMTSDTLNGAYEHIWRFVRRFRFKDDKKLPENEAVEAKAT